MDLEEHPRNGTDNPGFEAQEHGELSDLEEHSSEDEAPHKEEHRKSVLERRVEDLQTWLSERTEQIRRMARLVFTAGYVALLVAACVVNFHKASTLVIISFVVALCFLWDWLFKRYGSSLWDKLSAGRKVGKKKKLWIKRVVLGLLPVPILVCVGVNSVRYGPEALISLCGLLLLILSMMLFSKHPFRWPWKTIICGVSLQFYLAVLVTGTTFGKNVLNAVGDKAQLFMSFSDAGAEFVFGPNFEDHLFAFKVMPILVFMSTVISILQHTGFLSWLIRKLGFIMQLAVGTSPAESLAAAGNIFLGQTESVLLIRPYISRLTCSEIHAVMTGGFASISGSVLGSYIAFGVDPAHLLTASVMSSPASLAIAKTLWPETETSQIMLQEDLEIDKGNSSSLLEAACRGASCAIEVVANILVNIISCLALLALMDSLLSWVGSIFDCPGFSFTLICSYVFMPLSFMMGVPWEDSFIVADLIGKKTFINEFVAYQKLSEFIRKRKEGGAEYVGDVKQYLSERSETIATYALCGFSNVSSLAMLVGALTAIVPERQADISRCGVRSLIAGCVSCFMTACIAGILYVPDVHCPDFLNTAFNGTVVNNSSQLLACCSQLYNSVAVEGQTNLTLGAGFTLSSLRGCCDLSPPRVNCSFSSTPARPPVRP